MPWKKRKTGSSKQRGKAFYTSDKGGYPRHIVRSKTTHQGKVELFGKPDANRSIVIYVPSTEFDRSVSGAETAKRIKETVQFLDDTFGGTTRVSGTGSWVNEGKTINEGVVMVETMTNDKDLAQHKAELESWIRKKKEEWKQHSLTVEYEEDMHFV